MALTQARRQIGPNSAPQAFFLSLSADIIIYGGSAGGGKTYAILMDPLRYVDDPRFTGVVFRRTMPQVTNPGGLWDTSTELYGGRAKPSETVREWDFPSGAKIKFAAMQYESDRLQWQGSQITYIAFDELTHFTLLQFVYVGMSRGRSQSRTAPYVRATVNPDADSWVAEFLSWWIDQETGYAIKERAGVIRHVTRDGERWVWADTAEELIEAYPHHFRDPYTGEVSPPKSVTFVPASLSDNVDLMRTNPSYRAGLHLLPLVERQRLLDGNWKVKAEAGKVFNRAWFQVVDFVPDGGVDCRFWDTAGTAKQLAGTSSGARRQKDPDYTAGVKIRKVNGTYYVLDVIARQIGPAEVNHLIKDTAERDAQYAGLTGAKYEVYWEIPPGSAGIREDEELTKLLHGHSRGGVRPTGDKYVRSKPLAVEAQARNVRIARGAWNEEFLTHMHHQPDLAHDDIHDAAAGAFNVIATAGGVWVRDYAGNFTSGSDR